MAADAGEPKGGRWSRRVTTILDADETRARLPEGERAVRVGACNAQECVVETGLEEGDRLLPLAAGEGA